MQQTQMKQVAFTEDAIAKCQCMNCPVQENSACAVDEQQAMASARSLPVEEETPKVYCSHGPATCDDLDFSQQCICPTCAVWKENGLSNYKYCQNGSAAVQG